MTGFLTQKRVVAEADFYTRMTLPGKYVSIYIRYAQILLDYIEALNEYDPTNPDIQKYWDDIRKRAGLPSIFATYPDIKGKTEGSARVHPARASDRAQLRGRPLLHHAPSSALGDRSQSPHRQIRRCRFRMGPLRSRRRPEDQQLQVDRVLRARRFRAARIQESLLFVPHPAERDRQEPRSGPEPRMVMVFNTTKQ